MVALKEWERNGNHEVVTEKKDKEMVFCESGLMLRLLHISTNYGIFEHCEPRSTAFESHSKEIMSDTKPVEKTAVKRG